ncbi:hypothetical protein MXEN_16472 [Mycobacterium xenopi RIVM700367]|nr:hypothetical protein MXEN_16472 [Mycobacterium xenopi RIVM700367]
MGADRIEKQVVLRAPLERVWRAISDAEEFTRWFGVRFDGPLVAGTAVTATITPTTIDDDRRPASAAALRDLKHLADRRGRAAEKVCLPLASVCGRAGRRRGAHHFGLGGDPDGVLLTIMESGFDALPEPRRSDAFEANSGGWAHQVELVRKYLAGVSAAPKDEAV